MTRGRHRDAFVVDDMTGSRFALALERFYAGHAFVYRDVGFVRGEDGFVNCIVDSSWGAENVTAKTAEEDLATGAAVLAALSAASSEFHAVVGDRRICFELIEDYGNGSILICSQTDGVMTWAPGLPRGAG